MAGMAGGGCAWCGAGPRKGRITWPRSCTCPTGVCRAASVPVRARRQPKTASGGRPGRGGGRENGQGHPRPLGHLPPPRPTSPAPGHPLWPPALPRGARTPRCLASRTPRPVAAAGLPPPAPATRHPGAAPSPPGRHPSAWPGALQRQPLPTVSHLLGLAAGATLLAASQARAGKPARLSQTTWAPSKKTGPATWNEVAALETVDVNPAGPRLPVCKACSPGRPLAGFWGSPTIPRPDERASLGLGCRDNTLNTPFPSASLGRRSVPGRGSHLTARQ